MAKIIKVKVTTKVWFVSIPEAGIYILCGCPADSIKHLIKQGLIFTKDANGVIYETGPNVVLLSDVLLQNGTFSNLAEFPVLQMLYRQGMILPNHPNNTGVKPMLIGADEQVRAQLQYIYRGNYGLVSEEEICEAGPPDKNNPQEDAHEIMRLKLKFAFGAIRRPEELIDSRIIDGLPVEIRNGVMVLRLSRNVFEIRYKDEAVTVNLNLEPNEHYGVPYPLNFQRMKREYFAVVHAGEGDGWNVNHPCMSSIIMFQGKIYLLDAGPDVIFSLMALGVGVNEIEGIFHTHCHDDHFAGFTTLMRSDHRIKYYAASLVRASVSKKLAALMSIDEEALYDYFDVHDLDFNVWNEIDGLEVKPILSPHPVETSIFYFRTVWGKDYRTYAHLADVIGLDTLKDMVTDDDSEIGLSAAKFEEVKENYLMEANLKKIDIGGGMIHGSADDFKKDRSDKIVLSHTSADLTNAQKEIGSGAPFGMTDVIIATTVSYDRMFAQNFLQSYFPETPQYQLEILLNNDYVSFNPGSILIRDGYYSKNVYLILNGNVEWIQTDIGRHYMLSSGALIGDIALMDNVVNQGAFRALNCVQTLRLPAILYLNFVKYNHLYHKIKRLQARRECLQKAWLFGEIVSYPIQMKIADEMRAYQYPDNLTIQPEMEKKLYLIEKGKALRLNDGGESDTLEAGDFFGEEDILFGQPPKYKVRFVEAANLYSIPAAILLEVPVVRWKLYETYQKRSEN
ncbi:MBL fold metallo-hydrolase [Desulfococcaceae bacterium HSG9]|nr:MBL fold metallo-hydrolase [Desulfococcaceae bacterium HSG9]